MKLFNLSKKFKIKKEYLALLIFAVFVGIFYGSTLKNGFIYDDIHQVVENTYIHSLRYLPKVVTGCIWEHAFGQCKDRAIYYYRPVHTLSYLLTYQISSEPWIFHLVNLIYFFIIVSLIFVLVKILTNNFIFSSVTAFIFLIHPVNSETVNWIASVPELTLAIFVLLSTIFYIKYQETNKTKKLLAAAIFYFLAILSKEPAVLLPLIFLFIDWRLFKLEIEDFFEWREIKNYLILAGFLILYLLMRLSVLGNIIAKGPGSSFSFKERVYSFFLLLGQYLKKLIYPLPLIFFHYFEKKSEFFNLQFFSMFLVVFAFLAALFFFFKKKKNLLALSLCWIIIFLLPVLLFIGATGESVFSERYAFVPAIGFCMVIGYLFTYFWQKDKRLRIFLFLFLILITGISWQIIYNRNLIWKENEKIYTETLIQNPEATPIRFNYAVLLRNEKQDFEKAKEQLEEIVRRKPNWGDISMVYLHLGDYYQDKGQEEQALEYYHKSATASEDWKTHFAFNRLGVFYAKKEEYLKALIYFCQAVQSNPESQESRTNFDRAVSIISFNYEEDPDLLYNEIVNKKTFIKSSEEKIKFKNKICQEDLCAFMFLPGFEEYEVVLPLLILAFTHQNEAVKIENQAFNPKTGEVILEIDSKYKDESLNFIFPTCEGIYYQAPATP